MSKISIEFLLVVLVATILLAPKSTFGFGPCPEGYSGNVRNPLNCSTYYSCTPYGPQLMPCQENLCYNSDKDWCDWCNEVAECSGQESTTEINSMCQLPIMSSSSSYSYPIFFQFPGNDCGKFYFCDMIGRYGGIGYCAKGLWFDFEIQGCSQPWSNHCHFK